MQDLRRVDQETVYDLLIREQWTELLDLIHVNPKAVEDDPLLHKAVETFSEMFFERLAMEGPAQYRSEIEKLFLLHAGGHHRLDGDRFERVVVHLVDLHADRPEAAAGYARHYPSNEACAQAIARYDLRVRVEHSRLDRVTLDRTNTVQNVDRTVSLFKSRQEETFFMAARAVFPTYLVYPNVALSTVIDFDSIHEELSSAERRFFFTGVIDCVIFDQHEGYRPCYFFEIDSSLHDDAVRSQNDRHKDRIVSAAGKTLHRLRALGGAVNKSEIVRLMRETLEL